MPVSANRLSAWPDYMRCSSRNVYCAQKSRNDVVDFATWVKCLANWLHVNIYQSWPLRVGESIFPNRHGLHSHLTF